MKKIVSLFMLLAMLAVLTFPSFAQTADTETAESQKPNEIEAYVSITNRENKLAYAKVKVNDLNKDGYHSVHEALYYAHVYYYEGGEAEGYRIVQTEFGHSLKRLWGEENDMNFGYYVNDLPATNLDDPIKPGDHVHAFAYTDTDTFSDTYSYFDTLSMRVEKDTSVTLTLKAASYDADWNPVSVPVKDAYITFNGKRTDFKTDEEGKVTVTFDDGGQFLVGAVSDSMTLVPPVLVVRVEGGMISLGILILGLALIVAVAAFGAWYVIVRKKKKASVAPEKQES